MTRIGLISDTHGFWIRRFSNILKTAMKYGMPGDFGTIEIADQLKQFKPLKAVHGNIDGNDVRSIYPEKLIWNCEDVKGFMTHIGGHPARYAPGIKQELINNKAKIFICGHSHILKVMYDDKIGCLHINPGAAGNQGWHKIKTIIRFAIDGSVIKDCEVIEFV